MCVGMLMSLPTRSAAQTQEAERQYTVEGAVEAVDHSARTVTIRSKDGRVVTLDVPPEAVRFEQVKVGIPVQASYYDLVSVRLKPAGEPSVDRTIEPTTVANPGSLPGATKIRQRVATVTITGWDPVNRVVSFTGPNGVAYTRRLLDTTEPKIVEGLKKGDRVDVTRTEAVTVSVSQTVAVSAQSDPSLRNRLTISALFGVDNQFSGKMIQQSTGQTTGGAPINLDETSYDEVYGRIGSFKIGVGYRTTPRTEAVFNFIWSSSEASEVATPVGTVGAVPLNVNFTEYQYWGLEGGQRWFFARTRFTPFAGYLVGLNRHQDIRGTFVDVPTGVQPPGLVEQDGKFFEKSWAFSLGPTGGVLIGLGPFEVMAEAQLRFIGGLSDVDWLVEEDLRDVNSESSRWSIPVMFGARIRF
jgi:hypothetical protein